MSPSPHQWTAHPAHTTLVAAWSREAAPQARLGVGEGMDEIHRCIIAREGALIGTLAGRYAAFVYFHQFAEDPRENGVFGVGVAG